MDQKTYNLVKTYTNFDYWSDNTPIEQIPPWELRDCLSHSPQNFNLLLPEGELVNQIISSINTNINYTWNRDDLSILGEAEIQRKLRKNGFNLLCANLDIFPNNSQELQQYLSQYAFVKRLITTIDNIKNFIFFKIFSFKPSIAFNNFVIPLDLHFFTTVLILPFMIIYGIFFAPKILISSLIIVYILNNCVATTIHECWVHDLINPKNRIIGFILDYIGHVTWGTRLNWRYSHTHHHIHWKTPMDHDQFTIKLPILVYLMGIGSPKSPQFDLFYTKVQKKLEEYKKTNFNMLLPESQFLEKYHNTILLGSHLIILLVFGLINYLFFFLIQAWAFGRYMQIFSEYFAHYNNPTRKEEKDHPWLFPICCGSAYHSMHHCNPTMMVVGPGWLKYFNVQYYYIKLFYNLKQGARFS